MAELTTVKISAVTESPTNPRRRFDAAALDELAESIRSVGVLQPILVRPLNGNGRFECVFGHRRLRAAARAGLEVIPATVRELSDLEVAEAQLVENCQRVDVDPLEEADAYRAILDAGIMTAEDIAAKVGKSRSHVYGRIRLAQHLRPKARKALVAGQILASVALLLTRIEGKAQDQALGEVLGDRDGPLTVSEARLRLRSFTYDLRQAPFDTKDSDLVASAGPCTTCPKRTGNQRDLFGEIDGDEREACTDSKCYESKVHANWLAFKARAESKGLRVVEAKEVLEEYGSAKAGYVKADDEPRRSWRSAGKTWRRLVGKKLEPIVTQHPRTGAVVELYEAKAANRALPPEVKAALRGESNTRGSGKSKPKGAKANAVDETQLRELVHHRVAAELAEKAAAMSEQRFLEVLVLDHEMSGLIDRAAELCGWYPSGKAPRSVAKDLADKSAAQLRAVLLVDSFLMGNLGNLGIVDIKAIEKSVRADLVAQARAKARDDKAKSKAKKAAQAKEVRA